MLFNRKRGALLIIGLLALASTVPLAGASTITMDVHPQSNSANVTAYVNTSVTIKTNNSLVQLLSSFLSNLTVNETAAIPSNSPVFAGVQDAIHNNSSEAKLTFLKFELHTDSQKLSSYEWMLNYSLKAVMNITDIYHNNTFDLSWRGFYDNSSASMNSTSFTSIKFQNDTTIKEYKALNFTAFSKPLTEWQRHYDTAKNVTTFTTNAGYTYNSTFNLTYNNSLPGSQWYTNITVKSDPSYTIVTPGFAEANSDSIVITSTPNPLLPFLYIAVVVVLLAIGAGVTIKIRTKKPR